uniref:Kinesin motor domain-containing protein n=1 Tax=Timema poppense TaxID=170557 RepID=A0A7R9D2G5_TIMPO|nr:unnamed protein product [Timema poppensis]
MKAIVDVEVEAERDRDLTFDFSKIRTPLTIKIAMVSPGMSSCEHSLNTLRYADRVKELAANDPVEIKNSPSDDETMHVEGAHGLDDSDLAQLRSLNGFRALADVCLLVQSPGDFAGQTLVLRVLLVGLSKRDGGERKHMMAGGGYGVKKVDLGAQRINRRRRGPCGLCEYSDIELRAELVL